LALAILRHVLVAALLAIAAAAPGVAAERLIFVTSNGWHSGIVVARADLPPSAIPEIADFPDAVAFEFGWGDAAYYPARQPTLGLALSAALPGPAVLHLSGLPGAPADVFPSATVLALGLTDAGFARLIAFLGSSVERAGGPRAVATAPGLYPFSRFYPATGRFHAFNTCNTWTARGLAAAGVAIEPEGVQTADELIARLRPLARRD
jgi:uncharacterized protein (TIGR02117 family)